MTKPPACVLYIDTNNVQRPVFSRQWIVNRRGRVIVMIRTIVLAKGMNYVKCRPDVLVAESQMTMRRIS